MADKYTPQTEKVANVTVHATWVGAGSMPDTATVSAAFSKNLVHDDTAEVIDRSNGAISFDGMRTDRSVTVGAGPSLTYRQCTLYFLQMTGHMRANP
jgi:hypothetical protein